MEGRRQFVYFQVTKDGVLFNFLQNHIDGHTGVRPYHCPTCERSYRHKATLTEHLQSHSEENSYKCKLCNKVFQRYGTLKRHEFLHTGKKPFKCPKCEATFAFKDYLAVHMRKHVGVKRKTCPQCGKGLSDHNSLRRHTIAIHSESGTLFLFRLFVVVVRV